MSVSIPLPSNEKMFFVSFGVLSSVLVINSAISILPISGLTFLFIAIFIWFFLLCITFVGLHKLLQRNEPVSRSILNKYLQYLGFSLASTQKERKAPKINPVSIERLTSDIDKYFICKWYSCISEDADFSVESKAFLQETLTRLADVVVQVNHTCLLHGMLNLFLKHLKEFRRSLKRKEKYNVGIEELYRYSHICSISSNKNSKEYFVHQLTTRILQHFINSELWNSLPCHVLVSILARKLISYLLTLLSNPEILNYIILNTLASEVVKDKLKLSQYGRISIVEFFDVIDTSANKGDKIFLTKASTKDDIAIKAEELQHKVEEASKQYKEINGTKTSKEKTRENINKDGVKLRHRGKSDTVDRKNPPEKSPKQSDSVKIYEPKSSGKTWRDSRDLACVSLGQDPLDALIDGGKSSSKLGFWESTKDNDSPPSASHLFNEVIHMTSMEGLKTSMKPLSDVTERTLHNIKDLQEATVHNALHKIGDFQDEAAGMVEGILDFGRAGFRKGLRLTGLQDNIETAKTTLSSNTATAKTVTKSMREQVKKKLEELKKSDSDSQDKLSSADSADSIWINPIQIDSPTAVSQVSMDKIPSKPDIELNQLPRVEDCLIPSISTEDASGTNSPDPEYEDTADLASSIAKLRSLLQQRSSESNLSTPALSPMPDEYVILQKQIESENTSDVEALEVDGVMPSFYKFCTKTASGVFSNTLNTIKTALPGNTTESIYTVELWKFIADQKESDILVRMKKLLSERKEYCILDKEIDTGYDALDSVDVFQQSPVLISSLHFEDELDDFEGKIPITKVVLDLFCELFADTNSPLVQEPMIKAVLLVFGQTMEQKIISLIAQLVEYFAENLVTIPESTNSNVLSMDIDEYIKSIEDSTSEALKYLFGKTNFREALRMLISLLQKQKINEDLLLQGLELVAMKLIEESILISPPASA
ncbi:unnamed protein product [Ceutorhynchus assimilis]|uniref:PXA domain-containing protein n=1 Tax=Ceutorhynchus assimilis TaxID=467358 RepID=A0A9P0DCL3_9CUCU|nr:unnamed protein product [Ceutorhynchus assimilis]